MTNNNQISLPENFNKLPQLLIDYLKGSDKVSEFVSYYNSNNDWEKLISSKIFPKENREVLVHHLNNQYSKYTITDEVKHNLKLLSQENTYTVTTGHQLCLLTGPLFFVYKVASTIKLTQELKSKFPNKNFVPVYWLASEDHDFAEINHAYLFGKKISWNTELKGAVGSLPLDDLKDFLNTVYEVLGSSENAEYLKAIIKKTYQYNTLADATIALVNELFGKHGLICLDANHPSLKQQFIPVIEKELIERFSDAAINTTNEYLKAKDYQPIVDSKAINLFYIDVNLRERIEFVEEMYIVRNTSLSFTKEEILKLVKSNPEKFSPNVILRPLYQETILPNLGYVGGPSEIAYWMQFKKVFEAAEKQMPILIYRNSFYLCDATMYEQWLEMGFNIDDLKKEEKELLNQFLSNQNFKSISINNEIEQIGLLLNEIRKQAESIDKSVIGTINAEEQKLKNALTGIESKLNKALKAKYDKQLNQIKKTKEKFFPTNIPQERLENVFQYLLKYNLEFIDLIIENCNTNSIGSQLLIL